MELRRSPSLAYRHDREGLTIGPSVSSDFAADRRHGRGFMRNTPLDDARRDGWRRDDRLMPPRVRMGLHGLGRGSMQELRSKPTVVKLDCLGCPRGRGDGVATGLRMRQDLGRDGGVQSLLIMPSLVSDESC